MYIAITDPTFIRSKARAFDDKNGSTSTGCDKMSQLMIL